MEWRKLMSSFTVVITEAGPRPITVNRHFYSYEEAVKYVESTNTIARTIIYDDKGNVVDYIHPNGTKLDTSLIS